MEGTFDRSALSGFAVKGWVEEVASLNGLTVNNQHWPKRCIEQLLSLVAAGLAATGV
jgi:hypothetical protein